MLKSQIFKSWNLNKIKKKEKEERKKEGRKEEGREKVWMKSSNRDFSDHFERTSDWPVSTQQPQWKLEDSWALSSISAEWMQKITVSFDFYTHQNIFSEWEWSKGHFKQKLRDTTCRPSTSVKGIKKKTFQAQRKTFQMESLKHKKEWWPRMLGNL